MTTQIWTNVRSQSLAMQTTLTVVTPEGNTDDPVAWPESEPGLLVLLHGLTGNSAQWPVRADLQPLADRFNLVVTMPEGQRSFWINQAYGLRYGDWVGSELPDLMRRTLHISTSRQDTLVGGLSMGGYGAMRAAFDHPEVFGAAFSLSGCLDIAEEGWRGRHQDLYLAGFGSPDRPRPADDLIARLQGRGVKSSDESSSVGVQAEAQGIMMSTAEKRPELTELLRDTRLFASCGIDDALLDQSRLFAEAAGAAGVELEYQEGAGEHDFAFWNHWLPIALDHLLPE